MTDEQRVRFQEVFDMHDRAIAAMRAVNGQVQVAHDAHRTADDAFGVMIREHDVAIEAALEASRAAMALLRSME